MPAELKRARADFVIDNGTTLTELEQRVSEVWSALLEDSQARAHAAVS
jgi:dephospho-CoA kinase